VACKRGNPKVRVGFGLASCDFTVEKEKEKIRVKQVAPDAFQSLRFDAEMEIGESTTIIFRTSCHQPFLFIQLNCTH